MQEINLYNLVRYYARNWMWITAFTIIGLLAGFIYNDYIQAPLYKSTATLLMVTGADTNTTQDTTLINNYINLFESRRVLDPVIKQQQLNMSYDIFISSVEATNDKNTDVIKVAITSKDPLTSKSLVENAVSSFEEQVTKLYGVNNVQVVDNANMAEKPYNVHKELQLAISTTAGFVLSAMVLFFIYDSKINSKDSKKKTTKKAKTTKQVPVKKATNTLKGKNFGAYIERYLVRNHGANKIASVPNGRISRARVQESSVKDEATKLLQHIKRISQSLIKSISSRVKSLNLATNKPVKKAVARVKSLNLATNKPVKKAVAKKAKSKTTAKK